VVKTLIGSLKLQVIFRKRATNYTALLRKMTCEDKASYDSTPPCRVEGYYRLLLPNYYMFFATYFLEFLMCAFFFIIYIFGTQCQGMMKIELKGSRLLPPNYHTVLLLVFLKKNVFFFIIQLFSS